MKYSFMNDYSEGACDEILELLLKTNKVQQAGYSLDEYTNNAKELIKAELKNDDSEVHFLVGGTQTNLIAIASMLRPYEAVVSASSGHIFTNEAGAIEAVGHKVFSIPHNDGKITAKQIDEFMSAHAVNGIREHLAQPGLVYLSHPTEFGSIYYKDELVAIKSVCEKHNVPLFIDGARMGCALVAGSADITLEDLAKYTDAFYIGGTKMGALFGEAYVVNNKAYQKHFRTLMKQKGALLAKGRLLGLQFGALFTDDLYYKLAKHANAMTNKLGDGIKALGYSFQSEPVTNQLFPILPIKVANELSKDYGFYLWGKIDEERAMYRFVTSWATDENMVEEFLKDLKAIS